LIGMARGGDGTLGILIDPPKMPPGFGENESA
jgi:hypothetical protein